MNRCISAVLIKSVPHPNSKMHQNLDQISTQYVW